MIRKWLRSALLKPELDRDKIANYLFLFSIITLIWAIIKIIVAVNLHIFFNDFVTTLRYDSIWLLLSISVIGFALYIAVRTRKAKGE